LWFLFRLTEFAGIMPDTTKTGFEGWFDMRKGAIVPFEPSHPFFMNKEATGVLLKLASVQIGKLRSCVFLQPYAIHLLPSWWNITSCTFEHLGEIKSLKVLHELFS
jgi:DNA repair protein RecO (recombination protein O)